MNRPIHPLADIANLPKEKYWFDIFMLISLAVLSSYCLWAYPIISAYDIGQSVLLTICTCGTAIFIKRSIVTARYINSTIAKAKLIVKQYEQNDEQESEN